MYRLNSFGRIASYLLVLALIYPTSPILFKKFLAIKEPSFLSPLGIRREIRIRSDIMGDGHFGASRSNGRRRHQGIDITGELGESVFAARSGAVKTGEVFRGMGKYVKISHIDGYITVYGHLNAIVVDEKRWVWQGEKIGEVGRTGNANYRKISPHLHFEIRRDGAAQDPLTYIKK